jgi:hypothetical protein
MHEDFFKAPQHPRKATRKVKAPAAIKIIAAISASSAYKMSFDKMLTKLIEPIVISAMLAT